MFVAIFLYVFFVELGVDTSAHLNDGFMICWQRFWQGNSGTFIKICDSALAIIICLSKWIECQSALGIILFFLLIRFLGFWILVFQFLFLQLLVEVDPQLGIANFLLKFHFIILELLNYGEFRVESQDAFFFF